MIRLDYLFFLHPNIV